MEEINLSDRILKILNGQGQSARDICKKLQDKSIKKSDVNSVLYKLKNEGKVEKHDSSPPMWTKIGSKELKNSSDSDEEDSITAVFLDVGNSHCQMDAARYVAPNVVLYGFVPLGFGGEIPVNNTCVNFTILEEGQNVAIAMAVRIATLVSALESVKRSSHIIIVSKSNMFEGIESMLSLISKLAQITIIKNGWEGLKLYLE
jgi:hypothetical protein